MSAALFLSMLLLATAEPNRVKLLFAGDLIPHHPITNAARHCHQDDPSIDEWDCLWSDIKPKIATVDLAIINLETPISTAKDSKTGTFLFNAPTNLPEAIARVGFGVVSFANNHSRDQHESGILETRKRLAEAKLLSVGADTNKDAAWKPLFVERNGIRIGILSFTRELNRFFNPRDPNRPQVPLVNYAADPAVRGETEAFLIENVRAAAAQCDALIIYAHWGEEYSKTPKKSDVALAHALAEAGAQLIIGMHPHVIQPVETYQRADGKMATIAYSLGNFLSNQDAGQPNSPKRTGLMIEAVLEKQSDQATSTRVAQVTEQRVFVEHSWKKNRHYVNLRLAATR